MNRACFIVHTIALSAQGIREATGQRLIEAQIRPYALLRQIEQTLACAQQVFDAHQVGLLRESLESVGPDSAVSAALVLFDTCSVLELDDADSQRALTLADWSDVQCALAAPIALQEVLAMGP